MKKKKDELILCQNCSAATVLPANWRGTDTTETGQRQRAKHLINLIVD